MLRLEDDDAILRRIESCMHLNIPIEVHDEPTTIQNVMEKGTPTLPELWSAERIVGLKERARANSNGKGVYDLLKNYYLNTTSFLFPFITFTNSPFPFLYTQVQRTTRAGAAQGDNINEEARPEHDRGAPGDGNTMARRRRGGGNMVWKVFR